MTMKGGPKPAPITTADLEWWRDKIPTLDWVFAVTYAGSAPHEYVCERTAGMRPEDFERACRVIRTFGQPQKFYRDTRIYLLHERWKYWDMADEPASCTLINRGRADHVYGVQNAPNTASGQVSAYDPIATSWDACYSASDEERDSLSALVSELGDFRRQRVLDIGSGTGLALDLGITDPVRYTGVDPAQAMCNQLVRKHPLVAAIHPLPFADVLHRRLLGGTRYDLVLALGGAASYLNAADLEGLAGHATGTYLLTAYADDCSPEVGDVSAVSLAAARVQLQEFAATHGGRIVRVGRFDVAVPARAPA